MTSYPNDELAQFFSKSLTEVDPDIKASIDHELGRQQNQIELIASENIVSKAVLEAQAAFSPTNTPRVTPGVVTTAAANTSMFRKSCPRTARKSCSAVISSTCSRTPAHRPMAACSWRC